eukprot:jgi/Mesvir1/11870/Mv00217-RA.2
MILHRDIKSENIFLDDYIASGTRPTIKLGDFGIARTIGTQMATTFVGTPFYMSPELYRGDAYSFKSDVWSVGCVVYEMLTLSHAFKGINLPMVASNVMQGVYEPLPDSISSDFRTIVEEMLRPDADERPNAEDLLSRPFIKTHALAFLDKLATQGIPYPISIQGESSPAIPGAQTYAVPLPMARTIREQLEGLGWEADVPGFLAQPPEVKPPRRRRSSADVGGDAARKVAVASLVHAQPTPSGRDAGPQGHGGAMPALSAEVRRKVESATSRSGDPGGGAEGGGAGMSAARGTMGGDVTSASPPARPQQRRASCSGGYSLSPATAGGSLHLVAPQRGQPLGPNQSAGALWERELGLSPEQLAFPAPMDPPRKKSGAAAAAADAAAAAAAYGAGGGYGVGGGICNQGYSSSSGDGSAYLREESGGGGAEQGSHAPGASKQLLPRRRVSEIIIPRDPGWGIQEISHVVDAEAVAQEGPHARAGGEGQLSLPAIDPHAPGGGPRQGDGGGEGRSPMATSPLTRMIDASSSPTVSPRGRMPHSPSRLPGRASPRYGPSSPTVVDASARVPGGMAGGGGSVSPANAGAGGDVTASREHKSSVGGANKPGTLRRGSVGDAVTAGMHRVGSLEQGSPLATLRSVGIMGGRLSTDMPEVAGGSGHNYAGDAGVGHAPRGPYEEALEADGHGSRSVADSSQSSVEFVGPGDSMNSSFARSRSRRRFSVSDMRSAAGEGAGLSPDIRGPGGDAEHPLELGHEGRQGSTGSMMNGGRLVKLQPLPADLLRADTSGGGKPMLAPSLAKKLPSFSGVSGRGKVVLDPLLPAEASPTGKPGMLAGGGSKVLVLQRSAVSMTSAKT